MSQVSCQWNAILEIKESCMKLILELKWGIVLCELDTWLQGLVIIVFQTADESYRISHSSLSSSFSSSLKRRLTAVQRLYIIIIKFFIPCIWNKSWFFHKLESNLCYKVRWGVHLAYRRSKNPEGSSVFAAWLEALPQVLWLAVLPSPDTSWR